MTDETDINADSVVHTEACAWIAQLESGDMSAADRAELQQWMSRSPSHDAAIREYAALWQGLDGLALLQPAYDAELKKRRSSGVARRSSFWSPAALVGGLASLVLVFFVAGALVYQAGLPRSEHRVLATAIGEATQVDLSDGSTINLNTDSNVQVNFNRQERSVHLTNGEAVFSVAHDGKRPFVVHAGRHVVRAVGTEFVVRLIEGEVDVVVTEGRVEIFEALAAKPALASEAPTVDPAKAVLVRGQSARATTTGVKSVEAVDLDQVEQRLQWRNGMLDFSGETLQYAVDELMRYTSYQIEIEGEELANRQVGGVFRLSDADQFVAVLEQNFSIEAQEIGSRRVVLRAANSFN